MRLTGEAFAEQTDMSGTSLLDVGTGQYDAGLLDAFGIGTWGQKLPPLRLSTDVCGRVTRAAAELTGLKPGTPVAGGLFDIDACALSSALLDEHQLGMTFGTWGINQYVSPTPVVDNVFMTSRYCVPGYYLMLEGSATSAANLEWFLAQFFRGGTESAQEAGPDPYAQVDAWVAQTATDESGLLFLPFLYGSSVGADATGCLIGLSARHSRRHIARAVYEGVVFGHLLHLERLLAVRAMPQTIRASGGAARSDVWMQMAADVLQCPVEVPDGMELGALGAAMCAAVATGLHADYPAACAAMTRCSRRFLPHANLAPDLRGQIRAICQAAGCSRARVGRSRLAWPRVNVRTRCFQSRLCVSFSMPPDTQVLRRTSLPRRGRKSECLVPAQVLRRTSLPRRGRKSECLVPALGQSRLCVPGSMPPTRTLYAGHRSHAAVGSQSVWFLPCHRVLVPALVPCLVATLGAATIR